jgi:CTP:molybdopterin cytidylyltransferase MocA
MKPTLVILAAGASSRLGQPKVLAQIQDCGKTVLDHLLDASKNWCSQTPLVVAGADHDPIQSACKTAQVLNHLQWSQGRTGGLAAAVRARPNQDFLLWPADSPCFGTEDVGLLTQAFGAAQFPSMGWLAPRCPDGAFGHPVILGRELLALALALNLSPDTPLRDLRKHANPLWSVELSHSGARINLDTPAALREVRAWFQEGR